MGDFITVRNDGLARLDGVFLHQLSRGRNRLFARVTMVEDFRSPQIDSVLGVAFLKLSSSTVIIGLPGIGSKKHYVMHVKREEQLNGSRRLIRGGSILLLNWNHDIQFM